MASVAVRVVVSGHVQGVGYRAWVENEALVHRLDGWVRNRWDGTVEMVLSGEAAAVNAVVAACRRGPLGSDVIDVARAPYQGPPLSRFRILSTV